MVENFRHLFPFEKIRHGSRVLIYGAGEIGQAYLEQMLLTHYCEVVAMADKNYQKYPQMAVPVIAPDSICEYEFDYVVIALRVAIAYNEMHRVLENQGIQEEKIVCIFERNLTGINVCTGKRGSDSQGKGVRDGNAISMACLIVGGLGDHVIQKRFLVEIMKSAPEIKIDIYAIRHVEYLKFLFSDCKQIASVIEDLGTRYERNKGEYALSMAVEACHYIRVDSFNKIAIEKMNPQFAECIQHLRLETEKDWVDLSMPVHISIIRRLYQGCNVYSGFGYQGAFNISDKNVHIPVSDRGEEFFRSLHMGSYITVNYGSGECRDESKVAKMWPMEYFSQTIALLKKEYPDVEIVQLGDAEALKIAGVDRYVLGEEMECVASVLEHALFHLDIEGGLVHLATQLGTKCIVLFGPTQEEYYGYADNINIHKGSCQGCFGIYSDINRCARNMKKPECMYSITPETVMEHARDYMNGIGVSRTMDAMVV